MIDPSPRPTLSDWPTKQEAARILQVSEKTIERLASRGELQSAKRHRPGAAPIAVYHPEDLARLRQQQEPAPFVMPDGSNSSDGTTATGFALTPASQAAMAPTPQEPLPLDQLALLISTALRSLPAALAVDPAATAGNAALAFPGTAVPTVPLTEKTWLTLTEASALSGLSVRYIRDAIDRKKLRAIRDRSIKVRRVDVCKL